MSIDIMDVLTFYNLLLSAIGSVAGIILGFLPGISGNHGDCDHTAVYVRYGSNPRIFIASGGI